MIQSLQNSGFVGSLEPPIPPADPTWTENFSQCVNNECSPDWVGINLGVSLEIVTANNLLDYDTTASTSAAALSKDLFDEFGQNLDASLWTCDVNFSTNNLGGGGTGTKTFLFILSDLDGTNLGTVAQTFIGFEMRTATTFDPRINAIQGDNVSSFSADQTENVFFDPPQFTDFFARIRRTSTTTADVTLYTDNSRTVQLPGTLVGNLTGLSLVTNLRFYKAYTSGGTSSGKSNAGEITFIEITNGVAKT